DNRDEREHQRTKSMRGALRNKERKNGGGEKQDDAEASNQTTHLAGDVKMRGHKPKAHGSKNITDALGGEPTKREPEMLWNGHGVCVGLTGNTRGKHGIARKRIFCP